MTGKDHIYVQQTDLRQHNILVHSMNLIRERLNSLEKDCFRNRLHTVELGVQQQRMIHIQSQTFLNPMLMTEAPYNPYIHPYHAGPLHFHFPLQPAFSTMGNGFPVQNIAHYRQPHVFPAHQYTAHMGPSVYPRQKWQTLQGAPLIAREERIHHIPTTLYATSGIKM